MRGTYPSEFEGEEWHRPVHGPPTHNDRAGRPGDPRTEGALFALARLLAEIAVGAEERSGEAASAGVSTTDAGGSR